MGVRLRNGRRACRRHNSEAGQREAATLGATALILKPDVVDHGFGHSLGDFVDERAPLFDRHFAKLGAEHDRGYECVQVLATFQPGWVWNEPHLDIGESGRLQVQRQVLVSLSRMAGLRQITGHSSAIRIPGQLREATGSGGGGCESSRG